MPPGFISAMVLAAVAGVAVATLVSLFPYH